VEHSAADGRDACLPEGLKRGTLADEHGIATDRARQGHRRHFGVERASRLAGLVMRGDLDRPLKLYWLEWAAVHAHHRVQFRLEGFHFITSIGCDNRIGNSSGTAMCKRFMLHGFHDNRQAGTGVHRVERRPAKDKFQLVGGLDR